MAVQYRDQIEQAKNGPAHSAAPGNLVVVAASRVEPLRPARRATERAHAFDGDADRPVHQRLIALPSACQGVQRREVIDRIDAETETKHRSMWFEDGDGAMSARQPLERGHQSITRLGG